MAEQISPQTHLALICYQNALSHLAENRLLEAMVEVRRSLDADPDFYDGQFLKAHIHRLLGQYEEALPILERCLESLSDDVDVLREAAEVTLLAGETSASLKFFQRLHALDSEDEEVCARIVALAFQLGGARLALKKVRFCLNEFPEWAPGYLWLGNLLEWVGKPRQAEEAYRQTLRLIPDHRGARNHLERLYRGDPPEIGQFEKTYGDIFLSEAVRLSRDGHAIRSLRLLEKWRPRIQSHPEFLEVLAKTSFQLGRFRFTIAAIQEIRLDQRNPNVLWLEARSLASLGDSAGAVSRYGLLCERRPDIPEYWLEYLSVLGKTEDGDRAVRAVEEAVERLPNEPDLWFEAARIRKRYVDSASCIAALEKVVELRPQHLHALYALGVEKLLSGDAAGAIPALSSLTHADRNHLEGWRRLAIAFTRLKDWERSYACWSTVTRLAPTDIQAAGNVDKLDRMVGPMAVQGESIRRRQTGLS